MKIKFSLNISDYIDFSKEYLRRRSFLFKPYVFGIAVLVAGVLTLTNGNQLYVGGNEINNQAVIDLVAFVVTLAFLIGVIWVARSSIVNKYYKFYRSNKNMAGERSIDLGKTMLHIIKDSEESTVAKNDISEVGETRNYIYLTHGKRKIVLLPKKAGIDLQTIFDWKKNS